MRFRIPTLLLALACFWPACTIAAADEPLTPEQQAVASGGGAATVIVNNRAIVTFRSALYGLSAAERARTARARILEQLNLSGPQIVTQRPEAIGILIQIDGRTSFGVTPGDVDKLNLETTAAAASRAAAALELVIKENREARNLDSFARSVGISLAWTTALLALAWLAWRVRRLVQIRLVRWTAGLTSQMQIGGMKLLRRDRVAGLVRLVVLGCFWVVLLVAVYEWLSVVLSQFPLSRPLGERLDGILFKFARGIAGSVLDALPGIFTALVIFLLARWVAKILDSFFEHVQTGSVELAWLEADVAMPTRRIAKMVVWLFALAMAYPYLPGAGTEAFKGLSVMVGLMLSLGSANLIGQAVSGLILTYGRVFRKGEFVRVNDIEGKIKKIGVFATRIRTGMGTEITLSNSVIVSGTMTNYSRIAKGSGFVLDTAVTIGYDTPWRQVHAMLTEAAARTKDVLTDPAPIVFQTGLSDWYPEYRLVCQASPPEPLTRAQQLSVLHGHIQDVFNEYGVQIMSPHYFADPADAKVVARDQWTRAPAVPDAGNPESSRAAT